MTKSDLWLGASGDEVKGLHAKLRERRFHIPPAEAAGGYFGPATRQAVVLFQTEYALPVTGIVDPPTMAALHATLAGPAEPPLEVEAPADPGDSEASPEGEPASPEQPRTVNATCPWSNKPIHPDAVLTVKGRTIGFCSLEHRDRFKAAIEHFARQRSETRRTCPWSGRPVHPDATMVYDGQVIGFCSPAHRDEFRAVVDHLSNLAAAEVSAIPSATDDAMSAMEEVSNTAFAPPLVTDPFLSRFCQAVQSYANDQGLGEAAAAALRSLNSRLAGLRNLASLCRLAVVGHPLSFARVIDEMHCLAVDFPCDPLDPPGEEDTCCGEASDERVQLAAAVDLFAGAAFVSMDQPEQRDRFIIAAVRAIEDAIAFPVTYAAEAGAYIGQGTTALSPTHVGIVIANATQRLIDADRKCMPRAPAAIRRRLGLLARNWMEANPVTEFLAVVRGPRVHRIIRWKESEREQSDCARVGDALTLLLHPFDEDGRGDRDLRPDDFGVMFCPHQPAAILQSVRNEVQVRIPSDAVTGPVAVVRKKPDFPRVGKLLFEYSQAFPAELTSSLFAVERLDTWAVSLAFRWPVIRIQPVPATAIATAFTAAGQLAQGQTVAVNDTIAIQYSVDPPGSDLGATPTVTAPGGAVTHRRPGLLLFRPFAPGETVVTLSWGAVTATVPVSVTPASASSGATP